MELSELKGIIDKAIKRCQRKLKEQPAIVLTEADFERLVSWSIMKQLKQDDYKKPAPEDYVVHTQISHYPDGEIRSNHRPNIRPDIILLTGEGMEKADKAKDFKYDKESLTLELKYLRIGESIGKVKGDFEKRKKLYSKSWLFVVVLIESNEISDFNEKESQLKGMLEDLRKNKKYKENVFLSAIWKSKVHYFVKEKNE